MIYVSLLIGCLLLYKGGDWLLDGMLGIGQRLNLSKAIIGLILVSLGTSAPELFVSLGSALQGHGGMAAGNVVGSNIINISIVLGLTLCVVALNVQRVLQHQLMAVIVLSILTLLVTLDGKILRAEGVLLMVSMFACLLIAIRHGNSEGNQNDDKHADEQTLRHSLVFTAVGIVSLLIGAEALIWGGIGLANKLSLSETVIALTVTALGTSLPEIAASIVAVARRDTSLALGNVIGSNMLNIGLVLGTSAAIIPLQDINFDPLTLIFFIGLAAAVYALSRRPGYLPKWSGYLLVSSYVVYVIVLLKI